MKHGEKVWIRGYYEQDENGKLWVRVVCMYGLRIDHTGACSVKLAKEDVSEDRIEQARRKA